LEFFGFVLVDEDDEFCIYLCKGEKHIVEKANPFLYVEDINDANYLRSREKIAVPETAGLPCAGRIDVDEVPKDGSVN